MKLRNKKTGDIGWLYCDHISVPKKMTVFSEDKDLSAPHWDYNSLAELNEEWEDAPEEPKDFWFIDAETLIACESTEPLLCDKKVAIETMKQIGNYFSSREEAERAVENLKAWKRLKDKGFRFEGIKQDYTRFFSQQKPMRIGRKYLQFNKAEDEEWMKENWEDLDLLFGGEE